MLAALWLAEFSLEVFGARLAFRRRNWPLFSLLSFLALSDSSLVIIRTFFSGYAYGIASWVQQAGKYALLVFLATWIFGLFVSADKSLHARLLAAVITLLGAAIVVKVSSDGVTLSDRLIDAENAANIFVALILAVSWISRTSYLKAPWRLIAAGLLVNVAADIACTALWSSWDGAWMLYPAGAVPAYAIWCWSMRKEIQEPIEIRIPLEPTVHPLVCDEPINEMVI